MPRRFDQAYRVKRRDNLGDPEFWNSRFEDIDLRLAAREIDGQRIGDAVDTVTNVALHRLNDTFTPVIEEAKNLLRSIGAMFTARSTSTLSIGLGRIEMVVTEETQATFAAAQYLAVVNVADPRTSMAGILVDYNSGTGVLIVDVHQATLVTLTDQSWVICAAAPPLLPSTIDGGMFDGSPNDSSAIPYVTDLFGGHLGNFYDPGEY